MDFGNIAIGGVLLIPLIIGLVEFAKKLGVDGNASVVLAFALGIGFAGLWSAIDQGLIPAVALPWVQVGVVALGGGVAAMAAMGYYDLGKRYFVK